MAISAQMVKELREKTGAGMMDCKKALVEVNGDLEKAVDWLRQKGMAKAAKKSGRATCEGVVTAVTSPDGKHVAMASLMCETDFVARGDQFQAMAARVAQAVLEHNPADPTALDGVVGDEVKQLISASLISVGHAKVLLSVDNEKERILLARDCVNDQLTVRALEKKVARIHSPVEVRQKGVPDLPDGYIRNLTEKMKRHLGCAVRVTSGVTHQNGKHTKGLVEIDFLDNDDLDRIIRMIGVTVD